MNSLANVCWTYGLVIFNLCCIRELQIVLSGCLRCIVWLTAALISISCALCLLNSSARDSLFFVGFELHRAFLPAQFFSKLVFFFIFFDIRNYTSEDKRLCIFLGILDRFVIGGIIRGRENFLGCYNMQRPDRMSMYSIGHHFR